MRSLKNFLRSKDLFGHLITLNFNLRGQHHKTTIGGFVSICIKLFIYVYVILNFMTLFTYGNNKDRLLGGFVPLEQLGIVDYLDTNVNVFYVLRS